jgi:hypothetical protein
LSSKHNLSQLNTETKCPDKAGTLSRVSNPFLTADRQTFWLDRST